MGSEEDEHRILSPYIGNHSGMKRWLRKLKERTKTSRNNGNSRTVISIDRIAA
ncbi:MAG: hypothetical protein QXQ70_09325 [Candidatus Caldarchaeum sp.]